MNSWHQTFKRLSNAIELANIDSLRELEAQLEARQSPPPPSPRPVKPDARTGTSNLSPHALIIRLSEVLG